MNFIKITPYFLLFAMWLGQAHADIQSTSGNIDIDVNSDNSIDYQISGNGFGIGTAEPSANLHVIGNATLDGSVGIGTSSIGNSTLEISGTIAMQIESISDNTTLSGNSIAIADSSNGNLLVTLPDPFSIDGRMYTIKKKVSANKVIVTGGGNIDDFTDIVMDSGSLGSVHLTASNNQWHILSYSGNGTQAPSSNLIAWWKFDNISGNVLSDAAGNGIEGTLNNTVAGNINVPGLFHQTTVLDGVDDNFSFPVTPALNFGTGNFSLSFWFKSDQGTGNSDFIAESGGTQTYRIFLDAGRIRIIVRDSDSVSGGPQVGSTNEFHSGEWHHVVYIIDRVQGKQFLYVDYDTYSPEQTTAYTGNLGLDSAFNLGGATDFKGSFDDFRIYNKALSETEVLDLYLMGK